MPNKKAFVLRISPELMHSIEKWADDQFRSTNGQIEWILNDAVRRAKRMKKKMK